MHSEAKEKDLMEHNRDNWTELLDVVPQLAPDADTKKLSPAVCGGEFIGDTRRETQDTVKWQHALILDVDDWTSRNGVAYTIDDIRALMSGYAFVAWTTWSSRADKLRWRVVIPFASPLDVEYAEDMFLFWVSEVFEDTVPKVLGNPGRLGFFGTAKDEVSQKDYRWYYEEGDLFEPNNSELLAGFTRKPLKRSKQIGKGEPMGSSFSLSPAASSEEVAMKSVKRILREKAKGITEGNRHHKMYSTGLQLWWDWALNEKQVTEAMLWLNSQFITPKSEDDVLSEVRASWVDALGPERNNQGKPYGVEREPKGRASRGLLEDLGKKLKKAASGDQRVLGRAFCAAKAGEALCEDIEAKFLFNPLLKRLTQEFPQEDPKHLFGLLSQSVGALRAVSDDKYKADIPSDQEILEQIVYYQDGYKKGQETRETKRSSKEQQRLLRAFRGTRDYPYTEKEYDDFAKAGFLDDQWIIQYGKAYYFFVLGSYQGPFVKESAQTYAHTILAPAEDRVELVKYSSKEGKPTPKSIDDLMMDYGSYAMTAVRRMGSDKAFFNRTTQQLEQGICALADLTPTFVPEVDRWLRLLSGAKYDLFAQYLAAFTLLDRPLVALTLATAKGCGKDLLVYGLGRLWESFPNSIYKHFEETLEKCPIIWCNERVPKHLESNLGSSIKRWVSESTREIKKPYEQLYTLVGNTRLMFTANSMDDLRLFKESMNNESSKALRERLLYIDTTQNADPYEARKYLASLNGRDRAFVDDNLIAKHVLWLRDTVKLNDKQRFIVLDTMPMTSENHSEALAVISQENVGRVFDWISGYLNANRYNHNALLAREGVLYAHSPSISEHWSDIDNTNRGLPAIEVSKNLAKIAPRRIKLRVGAGSNIKVLQYRILDMDSFSVWLDTAELDGDDIMNAIERLEKAKSFSFA